MANDEIRNKVHGPFHTQKTIPQLAVENVPLISPDSSAASNVAVACPCDGRIVKIYNTANGDPGAARLFTYKVDSTTVTTITQANGSALGATLDSGDLDFEVSAGQALVATSNGAGTGVFGAGSMIQIARR